VARPVILFGAFDRHNFGDLLLAHIAAAQLGDVPLRMAALATRDLRRFGGHALTALADLIAGADEAPAALIHVGGEVLDCPAWPAAVMLLPPEQLQPTIAYLDARPKEQREWVRRLLRSDELAPYLAGHERVPRGTRVLCHGVGGVGLAACEPALRAEVLAKLRGADGVSVRDRVTLGELERAGIAAGLAPDPALQVAELFGPRIGRHAEAGEVARVCAAFPQGYLAVQFSAEFGDDATLAEIAAQLDEIAAASGCGVALFCAGIAPWHDDPAALGRVASRMRRGRVELFGSFGLWDICALIARSRGYCGSSLHGRIVAMAYGLPRVSLAAAGTGAAPAKAAAFAATWDSAAMPATIAPHEIAIALRQALAQDPLPLRQAATRLAAESRRAFAALRAALTAPGTPT
jgi:hypothetical protein